ncbi:MAG: CdaR family protein [Acidobacteriota bacterium]
MPRRRLFFRNLGLKLLALAIALGVWFALSGQRRERISERSYRIPLSLINIPAPTMVASPLPGGVDVRVRGPFTALRQLEPEKLEAVIDLRNAPPGERQYRFAPEDINVPPEVEIIAIAPAGVRIALDRIGDKLLPIVPDLSGDVAAGFEVVGVTADPRVARIVGPAAALEKMTGVGTEPISLANRSATFSATTTVYPNAPGVRVREGQVVDVTVRIGPSPTKTPGPQVAAP